MVTNPNSSSERLRAFDFLRGVAIVGVIAVHTSQSFPSGSLFLDAILSRGAAGVQLFFFISAVTMCYMWKRREGELNPIKKFYARRFLRIAPLFWLAVPIYLLINGRGASYWAPEGIGYGLVLLTVTFFHGFWPSSINSVVPGGWSIAVEMTFYVLFPILITAAKDDKKIYLFAAASVWLFNVLLFQEFAIGFFAEHYKTASATIVRDFLYLNFINQAPIFLLGCYLFFIIHSHPSRSELIFLGGWVFLVGALHLWMPSIGFSFFLRYMLLGVFAFTCIKLNVKFLPLELLGRSSYAIYIVHFLVLHFLQQTLPIPPGLMAFVVGLTLTTLISYVISKATFFLIENRVQYFADTVTGKSGRP